MDSTPNSGIRPLAAALAFAAAFGLAAQASAQESEGESPSNESSSANASASGPASSESKTAQATEAEGPDPDDPNYWSKVRNIHTVQKREFQKVNRLAVTAYGGIIPNNIFERYYPLGLRIDYFILENIGLELAGSRSFKASTSLKDTLNETEGVNAKSVRVADSQVWHTNFGLLWSPFYGKAAWYEEAIGYFDLYLVGGAGMVVTATPEFPNQPKSQVPQTIKPEGVLGAGLAWYFSDHISVRADYRQFIFQKVKGVGGVANPSEVSLGFTWFF